MYGPPTVVDAAAEVHRCTLDGLGPSNDSLRALLPEMHRVPDVFEALVTAAEHGHIAKPLSETWCALLRCWNVYDVGALDPFFANVNFWRDADFDVAEIMCQNAIFCTPRDVHYLNALLQAYSGDWLPLPPSFSRWLADALATTRDLETTRLMLTMVCWLDDCREIDPNHLMKQSRAALAALSHFSAVNIDLLMPSVNRVLEVIAAVAADVPDARWTRLLRNMAMDNPQATANAIQRLPSRERALHIALFVPLPCLWHMADFVARMAGLGHDAALLRRLCGCDMQRAVKLGLLTTGALLGQAPWPTDMRWRINVTDVHSMVFNVVKHGDLPWAARRFLYQAPDKVQQQLVRVSKRCETNVGRLLRWGRRRGIVVPVALFRKKPRHAQLTPCEPWRRIALDQHWAVFQRIVQFL